MGGDGYSVASEKLSKNSMLTDIRSVYVPQDKNSSHPEEYELKKPGSERWIWWYTIHMAAESMEQKLEFRRGLEDLKKKQEKTKDKRVWWYEVSEAMDKHTGKPKQVFWKEADQDYEYIEGDWYNITYSNDTESTASRLNTNETEKEWTPNQDSRENNVQWDREF